MINKEEVIHFNNLILNRVDTASGVFIGNNYANGWRSSSKSNQGFGQTSSSINKDMVNIVIDNDEVDSIINDSQNQTVNTPYMSEQTGDQRIDFQSLNVNALNNNATISMGENQMDQWRSHHKSNMGFGEGTGINFFFRNFNLVDDEDIIDTPINDSNVFMGDQDNI